MSDPREARSNRGKDTREPTTLEERANDGYQRDNHATTHEDKTRIVEEGARWCAELNPPPIALIETTCSRTTE